MKNICIIGCGKVGSAFITEFDKNKYKLTGAIDNNPTQAKKLLQDSGNIKAELVLSRELINNTDIFIFCVQDNLLSAAINEIKKFKFNRFKIFLHTSGYLTSDIFDVLEVNKKYCGSFHPAQTFDAISKKNEHKLNNIYFGIEGGIYARKTAIELISSLKCDFLLIEKEVKPAYHLACVIASNLPIINFTFIEEISKHTGLDRLSLFKITEKLINNTLDNFVKRGTAAMTGPVRRDDKIALKKHKSIIHKNFRKYEKLYDDAIEILYKIKSEIKN